MSACVLAREREKEGHEEKSEIGKVKKRNTMIAVVVKH